MWREEEQEDSCSSCSSYLYLESSNDTEIITVPAEHVPRVPSEVDKTFLMERLMEAYRRVMEDIWHETEDGGAHGSHDTDTVPTADTVPATDTVPNTDQDTDKDQDIDINQTQDSHDTSARH